MEHLTSIFLVIGLFLLGAISPGPNFLVVTQQSLNSGHRAGIITGFGVAFGDFIYASAGLFGLATMITLAGWLFGLIKALGGIYLIYLGIKMIKSKKTELAKSKKTASRSLAKCFRLGLLTDLANPKTILFFASIFATAVTPNTPKWVLGCMLAGIVLTSVIWRTGLSYLFSRNFFREFYMKFRNYIEIVFGAILIVFGLRLTSSIIIQSSK